MPMQVYNIVVLIVFLWTNLDLFHVDPCSRNCVLNRASNQEGEMGSDGWIDGWRSQGRQNCHTVFNPRIVC